MKRLKKQGRLLKDAFSEFVADDAMKLSASLAYYTIFSLGPLVLVIISIAGVFFETKEVTWQVYWQIHELTGQAAADQLFSIITSMQDRNAGAFSIIGGIILLFGATTVFADMKHSINYLWSIKAKPKRGWLKYLKDRLLSFSLIVGLAFLLIVSLFVSSAIDYAADKLFSNLRDQYVIFAMVINFLLVFIVTTLLFAVIYKLLPDAHIAWRDARRGAFFTALLFMVGKYLISLYISSAEMDNTYGAAAAIIIILSWVYYTAIILYFGAEYTKVYAVEMGAKIRLKRDAVFVVKKETEKLPPFISPVQPKT